MKDEVGTILRHLSSGKSLGWEGVTNENFERYSNILKVPLALVADWENCIGVRKCMDPIHIK